MQYKTEMKFFNSLFGKQEEEKEGQDKPISISEFWDWFDSYQDDFYKIVKAHEEVESRFINPVFDKLNQIRKGAFILVGMLDEDTAELILTAEGNIKNFPFILELIAAAPKLDNWKFTAFKSPMDRPGFNIEMGSKSFGTENIFFYPIVEEEYPDDIIIHLIYQDKYEEDEEGFIENGVYIFHENYLGELKAATQIDEIEIIHEPIKGVDLVPIEKLSDYMKWREKEFIEKYEGKMYDTENANYSSMEWTNKSNDRVIIGVCNTDLINWDAKASHPWVLIITCTFDESENNGMPMTELLEQYYTFEDSLRIELKDANGYLHIGQTTGEGERKVYYANKDYDKPISVLEKFKSKVDFPYDFEIFKDKYWRSMNHFDIQ